jgi:hypothetical protein
VPTIQRTLEPVMRQSSLSYVELGYDVPKRLGLI